MKVLDRLPAIADEMGLDYDTIVFRYLVERTLARLGAAQPGTFVLKGGLYMGLLARVAYTPYRATKDADLTAFGQWGAARLQTLFTALLTAKPDASDGVWYSGKIRVKDISRGRNYQGTRVRIKAHVGHESRLLSFDISHGAALAEPVEPWTFPALIAGMAPPDQIRVYPITSVISEKLHAFHTYPEPEPYPRIRDVYDLAWLFTTRDLDGDLVAAAALRTFTARHPTGPAGEIFWAERPRSMVALHRDPLRLLEWADLLQTESWFSPSLSVALATIELFADPLLDALHAQRTFAGHWPAGGPWQGG